MKTWKRSNGCCLQFAGIHPYNIQHFVKIRLAVVVQRFRGYKPFSKGLLQRFFWLSCYHRLRQTVLTSAYPLPEPSMLPFAVLRQGPLQESPGCSRGHNPAENSIRPVSIGRKNYLFAGSHEGAKRSAMPYSLTDTCKLLSIEPFEWLKNTLEKIPSHPINRIK